MRGEVLISVNIPISHFPLSLTHSALNLEVYEFLSHGNVFLGQILLITWVLHVNCKIILRAEKVQGKIIPLNMTTFLLGLTLECENNLQSFICIKHCVRHFQSMIFGLFIFSQLYEYLLCCKRQIFVEEDEYLLKDINIC